MGLMENAMMHKFKACKYLDFYGKYIGCHKEVLANGKVFWFREKADPSMVPMVQFCKKIGRLNHPQACTSDIFKMCRDYEESLHEVPISELR